MSELAPEVQESVNRFLHGKIEPDKCWHDFKRKPIQEGLQSKCRKCGLTSVSKKIGELIIGNTNYFIPSGFFKVKEWAEKQEWWDEYWIQWTIFKAAKDLLSRLDWIDSKLLIEQDITYKPITDSLVYQIAVYLGWEAHCE